MSKHNSDQHPSNSQPTPEQWILIRQMHDLADQVIKAVNTGQLSLTKSAVVEDLLFLYIEETDDEKAGLVESSYVVFGPNLTLGSSKTTTLKEIEWFRSLGMNTELPLYSQTFTEWLNSIQPESPPDSQ